APKVPLWPISTTSATAREGRRGCGPTRGARSRRRRREVTVSTDGSDGSARDPLLRVGVEDGLSATLGCDGCVAPDHLADDERPELLGEALVEPGLAGDATETRDLLALAERVGGCDAALGLELAD